MDSKFDRAFLHRRHSEFQRRGILGSVASILQPLQPLLNGGKQTTTSSPSSPSVQGTPSLSTSSTSDAQPSSPPSQNSQAPPPEASPAAASQGGSSPSGMNPSTPSQAGQPSTPGNNGGSGNNVGPGNSNPSLSIPLSSSSGSQSVPNVNAATGSGTMSSTTSASVYIPTPVIENNIVVSSSGGTVVTPSGALLGFPGPSAQVTTSVDPGFGYTSAGSVPVSHGSGPSSGRGGGGGSGGGGAKPNSTLSKSGLSSGAIAGIIISLIILLLVALIFFIRRRHKVKQNARREVWMKYRNEAFHGNGLSSTRSSFASPGVSDEAIDSDLFSPSTYLTPGGQQQTTAPQIAELALPPIAVVVEHVGSSNGRGSVYSLDSASSGSGSDSHAQFLPAPENTADSPLRSPMSVRPWTPSESWAFPKPPLRDSTSSPATAMGDPFTELSGIETIKRPFAPTMSDELLVVPGDKIRILNTYNDGWAMVEKLNSVGGKAMGLIPIDCLRCAGEALSTFIASKRLSSYDGAVDIPRAL